MANKEEVIPKIKSLISASLGVSEDEIALDSSFIDDLGADSLDIVELVMKLEDKFDMKIPDEDAEGLKTVGDAISYIESNSNKV